MVPPSIDHPPAHVSRFHSTAISIKKSSSFYVTLLSFPAYKTITSPRSYACAQLSPFARKVRRTLRWRRTSRAGEHCLAHIHQGMPEQSPHSSEIRSFYCTGTESINLDTLTTASAFTSLHLTNLSQLIGYHHTHPTRISLSIDLSRIDFLICLSKIPAFPLEIRGRPCLNRSCISRRQLIYPQALVLVLRVPCRLLSLPHGTKSLSWRYERLATTSTALSKSDNSTLIPSASSSLSLSSTLTSSSQTEPTSTASWSLAMPPPPIASKSVLGAKLSMQRSLSPHLAIS